MIIYNCIDYTIFSYNFGISAEGLFLIFSYMDSKNFVLRWAVECVMCSCSSREGYLSNSKSFSFSPIFLALAVTYLFSFLHSLQTKVAVSPIFFAFRLWLKTCGSMISLQDFFGFVLSLACTCSCKMNSCFGGDFVAPTLTILVSKSKNHRLP